MSGKKKVFRETKLVREQDRKFFIVKIALRFHQRSRVFEKKCRVVYGLLFERHENTTFNSN